MIAHIWMIVCYGIYGGAAEVVRYQGRLALSNSGGLGDSA